MSDHNKKDWHKFKEENLVDEDFFDEPVEEALSEQSNHGEQALDHPSYSDLEEKLTLAEQQAHEHWEKSVRALAELDNVRRRMEREVANAHKYGVEKLLSSLLPVMDSLEQALQLADKNNDSAMHEGLELTMKLFLDVLQKFDVEQIDPMGQVFDPQQHEAMSMQPAPESAPNTVIMVFQKGYKLSDRVIRPARVVVSTK
ncbi:nucleotide exchange factor GrpE [Legionella waltersii]|uniref:Protein GrpE n=1 Tax=Legionella waltersii TaxID=66969 RepID=A0A0W1AMV7_9GAMM|nr:nucleotide exchange factor GrpE [Legionella waltersii]KTD82622.1 heat shock protein GrpE [Legionella waltersii]SNV07931.1 heat shock protein GrpE [Legionella waltersii]